MAVEIGTTQQTKAAIRHVVCVPKKKTVEKPNVAAIPAVMEIKWFFSDYEEIFVFKISNYFKVFPLKKDH